MRSDIILFRVYPEQCGTTWLTKALNTENGKYFIFEFAGGGMRLAYLRYVDNRVVSRDDVQHFWQCPGRPVFHIRLNTH